MDGIDDVIERVIGDLVMSVLIPKRAQLTWDMSNREAVTSIELPDIIIDSSVVEGIIVANPTENWSVTQSKNVETFDDDSDLFIKFKNGKVQYKQRRTAYRYTGSMDDILAWCMSTKLILV